MLLNTLCMYTYAVGHGKVVVGVLSYQKLLQKNITHVYMHKLFPVTNCLN